MSAITTVSRRLLAAACLLACAECARKTNKDFAAMSENDWDRVFQDWEDEEEKEEYEYKPPKQKGIDMEKLKKAKGKELEVRRGPVAELLFAHDEHARFFFRARQRA